MIFANNLRLDRPKYNCHVGVIHECMHPVYVMMIMDRQIQYTTRQLAGPAHNMPVRYINV